MSETTISGEAPNGVEAPVAQDAETPVQVIAGEIADEIEELADDVVEAERALTLAVRHVLERQLVAGQNLSSQVVLVATDITAALVEAPGQIVGAIRDGATLPAAVSQTSDSVSSAVTDAGNRLRSAVGGYAISQAPLPHAFISGFSDVAGTLVRAQGEVFGAAVDSALTVATAATRDEDVRDTFDREWQELAATFTSARGDLSDAVADARDGIRVAVSTGDDED